MSLLYIYTMELVVLWVCSDLCRKNHSGECTCTFVCDRLNVAMKIYIMYSKLCLSYKYIYYGTSST